MKTDFWRSKQVFVTGHTGFKGGWLSLWLQSLGATVTGYALTPPPTQPNLFELARVGAGIHSHIADIRELPRLSAAMREARPEIVIHLAAQPLVRQGYADPVETYATNVMGTVHLLEAVRATDTVRVVLVISSDKCYDNREWVWGYRESEPMGGYDPYSSSKGCTELVTAAYRLSFFNPARYPEHGVALASARAGNVIGGGDWAADRLIPDIMTAFLAKRAVVIRNPGAIRPWQHVLEPLSGYLELAEKLWQDGPSYSEGWNFGPVDEDARPVSWIADQLVQQWGNTAEWRMDGGVHPHEAHYLKLDISKARSRLGWQPRWRLEESLGHTVAWYRAYADGADLRQVCLSQIALYSQSTDTFGHE